MQKDDTTLVTRQNMFHVTVRLFDRWRQNVFSTKIDAWGEAECVTDVLNTSCHFLWSITGQTHCKMESICFTLKRGKNCVWWHRPCVCFPIHHKKEPIWRRILWFHTINLSVCRAIFYANLERGLSLKSCQAITESQRGTELTRR